jgi:hypothetical protein
LVVMVCVWGGGGFVCVDTGSTIRGCACVCGGGGVDMQSYLLRAVCMVSVECA